MSLVSCEVDSVNPISIPQILRCRARETPDRPLFHFLADGESETDSLTFGALDRRARLTAGQLLSRCQPGDRALLSYPPGLDFATAFFGCLYAEVVAVPVCQLARRDLPPLTHVAEDCAPTLCLTSARSADGLRDLFSKTPKLRGVHVLNGQESEIPATESALPNLRGDSIAYLQYTSGSTAEPRGVTVSHANLLHASAVVHEILGQCSQQRRMVSWLPTYHDMGLMAAVQAVYAGVEAILMPPSAFTQQPLRWLEAISKFRATESFAPNSAYDLCVDRITPEQRGKLDLSSWRAAINSAEPVRAATIERFSREFAACGFRRSAFLTGYGLAENTSVVTSPSVETDPTVLHVDRRELQNNKVVQCPKASPHAYSLVCNGRPRLDQQVRIVDPATGVERSRNEIGEIWVCGSSVAQGYWKRPEETSRTFHARLPNDPESEYLRTEDLGFMQEGELYVTGRVKDLVITRGENHYPQDIEQTVAASHPALANACAVFSVDSGGGEEFVVAQEVTRSSRKITNTSDVFTEIRLAVAERHGIEPAAIYLLRPGSIPHTTSGKVQRSKCREDLLAGGLRIIAQWQPSGNRGNIDWTPGQAVEQSPILSNKTFEDTLRQTVARVLGIGADDIDRDRPLAEYGLESRQALSLVIRLESKLNRMLPRTLPWNYPTIASLASYLSNEPSRHSSSRSESRRDSLDVAIVGIGCRFPSADGPEAFWRLLRDGVDAVTAVPESRLRAGTFVASTMNDSDPPHLLQGGFLERIDEFDPRFFGLSPREAASIDPQHRLLLEASWEALGDAGIVPDSLAASETGVFVGISSNDYLRLQSSAALSHDPYAGTANGAFTAANRLSYLLDLRGPCWTVDTACSSSLVAVHQACQFIRSGDCEAALAGGVNLTLSTDLSRVWSLNGMLSPTGRCKAFDADADGYVRGEGCGVIFLKRLDHAIEAGDHVYAVIRGSAVAHDGRTNGLTAPSGLAQRRCIQKALENAGVEPLEVGYVEAHGTGTPLGDPIEFEALVDVFRGRPLADVCRIGSVKTNVGHLEAAAGIAGLIKVALMLENGQIPPHLHLRQFNPHISGDPGTLAIPSSLEQWPESNRRRVAGVSSFGIGGTNAHVILEEAPNGAPRRSTPVSRIQFQRQRCWFPESNRAPRSPSGEGSTEFLVRSSEEVPPVVLDVLRESLAELLQVSVAEVVPEAELSQLGVDSWMIFETLQRVERDFNVKVPVSAMQQELRSLNDVAAVLQCILSSKDLDEGDRTTGQSTGDTASNRKPTSSRAIPLTDQQILLWEEMHSESQLIPFNETAVLRLQGEFDQRQLNAAVQACLARHEALRTYFLDGTGQHISDTVATVGHTTDLSAESKTTRQERCAGVIESECHYAFDLSEAPLFRWHVVRCSRHDHLIVLTGHQLVIDRPSFEIVVSDLFDGYQQVVGEESVVRKPARQFHEYADARANSGLLVMANQRYWLDNALSDVDGNLDELRHGTDKRSRLSPRGTSCLNLETEVFREIRQSVHSSRHSLFILLLTAFCIATKKRTNEPINLLWVDVSQRTGADSDMVGNCSDLVPVQTPSLQGRSLADAVAQMHQNLAAAYDHRFGLHVDLIRMLRVASRRTGGPTVAVSLHRRRTINAGKQAGLKVEWLQTYRSRYEYDLALDVIQTQDEIALSLDYSSDAFSQVEVEDLATELRQFLAEIADSRHIA